MTNVKGKWALLTGASRGIGYLSAVFMAKQGCNLVLHSRKAEHCEKVLAEVKALGVEAYVVEAELSDLDSVEKMLKEIDAKQPVHGLNRPFHACMMKKLLGSQFAA